MIHPGDVVVGRYAREGICIFSDEAGARPRHVTANMLVVGCVDRRKNDSYVPRWALLLVGDGSVGWAWSSSVRGAGRGGT